MFLIVFYPTNIDEKSSFPSYQNQDFNTLPSIFKLITYLVREIRHINYTIVEYFLFKLAAIPF